MTDCVLRGDVAGAAHRAPELLQGLGLPFRVDVGADRIVDDLFSDTVVSRRCIDARQIGETVHMVDPCTLFPFTPVAAGAHTKLPYFRKLSENVE